MGVYTVNVPITPLTSGGGLTSGDEKIPGFPGKWTAATASGAGTYTGSVHPSVGLIFEGFGLPGGWEDFYSVTAAGGNFSFTAQISGHAAGAYQDAPGGFDIRFDGIAWTSITLNSLSFTLTGTPAPSAAPAVSAIERLIQIAPNLFFETPEYPPLDLQPEAGPVTFPDPQWGPGAYTDVFDPFGNLRPGAAGALAGNQKVRGRQRVACLRRKGHVYLNIGPSNLPAVTQISLPGDAQWLKFTPGLANLGASAGNGNIGIRIYAGQSQFKSGVWTTGYSSIPVAPDWTGNGSFADLFPWERPLQFFVELTGLAATIPASSLFEFCFDGFDLG